MNTESCPPAPNVCLATALCPVAAALCPVATPVLCCAACVFVVRLDEKHIWKIDHKPYTWDNYEVQLENLRSPRDFFSSPSDSETYPGMSLMRYYDGPSTTCSSARSLFGNRSQETFPTGIYPTDCSSDISWNDAYEVEDVASLDLFNDYIGASYGMERESCSSVLADCCCECDHALRGKEGQLWCPVCSMWDSQTSWRQESRCKSAILSRTSALPSDDTSMPSDEPASLFAFGGECYRTGIGREVNLVTPGFRAGGGTAGPWWSRTDPWFLGK
eukprot:gnl/TRDRNA2_/TRDRNA2_170149_c0_seq10.p1 gnl/TRDRNA2_/TRDRNA2_170149_c0~~gnl/TRDRNA2_/TRDRNA2_170149_c0_seq10.p1  ORF type:complete len:274 (+),score=5.26 gnl/TRDRNA2_/TRDRNA2_170149_c0_seq10:58-879(+)